MAARRAMLRAPLVRTTLGLGISRGISGTLLVLASVVVARAAGASTLGVFGLALTVGLYASMIGDLGVSAYLLPALGRSPRGAWSEIWADVVRFELRSALPLTAVYAVLIGLLTHGPERLALLAAAPWWLLFRVNLAARSVFTVAERVGAEAVATVTESAISLAAIALVMLGSHSPALATLCLALGATVGLAVRARGVRALAVAGGRARRAARVLARESLPFAGYTILSTLYLRIDVLLLSLFATARELGLYQPPVRFATAMIILPDALSSVLLGRASHAPDSGEVKRRQEQLLAIGVPIGLVFVVLSAVFGKAVLGALYGHEFRQAWLALTLLAATAPISFIASVNGNALTARGLQRTRVLCLGVTSVVAVSLGVPAIVLWGYNGAAGVSVVNELVLAAAYAVALLVTVGRHALVLPRPRFA
jgi:O-antigen/teichoic acid export membrane protein